MKDKIHILQYLLYVICIIFIVSCSPHNDRNNFSITGIINSGSIISYKAYSPKKIRDVNTTPFEVATLTYSENGMVEPVTFRSAAGDSVVLDISEVRKIGDSWMALNFEGYFKSHDIREDSIIQISKKFFLVNFNTRKAYDFSEPLFRGINEGSLDVSDLLYYSDETNEYVVFTAYSYNDRNHKIWCVNLAEPTKPYPLTNDYDLVGDAVYITESGYICSFSGSASKKGFADIHGVMPYRLGFIPTDDLDYSRLINEELIIDRWGGNHYLSTYVDFSTMKDTLIITNNIRRTFYFGFDSYCYDLCILAPNKKVQIKLSDDKDNPVLVEETEFKSRIPDEYWEILKKKYNGREIYAAYDFVNDYLYYMNGDSIYRLSLCDNDAPEILFTCKNNEVFSDNINKDKLELINGKLYFVISSGPTALKFITLDPLTKEYQQITKIPEYSSVHVQEFNF